MQDTIYASPEIIEEIKSEALSEFEQLSKIYRPTFKTRKFCDYLKQRIVELRPGTEVYEDCYRANLVDDSNNPMLSSGNIWFDLPANDERFKNNEPIILQAHMDMVCTYTTDEAHQHMRENGVELEYHMNGTLTSKDNLTSLGADNGIGIAIMLAITKSDNFKHGPIRFIFTSDEEVGMSGASYLGLTKQGEKGSPVTGFKYLINNDNAFDGEILISTAGRVISAYMLPPDVEAQPLASGVDVYTIDIGGLLGGHSGDWIVKHASAVSIAQKILNEINKTEDFRLIELNTPDCHHQNVIHNHVVGMFATSLSQEDIQTVIDKNIAEVNTNYPDETGLHIKLELAKLPKDVVIKPYSHEMTNKMLELMATIKTGVLSWKDRSIDWVETSGNLGPVALNIQKHKENGKDVWDNPTFELQSGFRSCNNEHVNQLAIESKQLAKDILGNNDLDYYRLKNIFYGWAGNDDEKFLNAAKRAYEQRGVKWTTRNLHGGLEISWFKHFNPDLNMLSFGAEIHNMHTTQETLYTGTLDGVISATLDCINHMRFVKSE